MNDVASYRSYRTHSATFPLPGPQPTTIPGHCTTCCKSQSSAPEDEQKVARNMLSWSWRSIKLLLLHLVGFSILFYLHWWCTVKHKSNLQESISSMRALWCSTATSWVTVKLFNFFDISVKRVIACWKIWFVMAVVKLSLGKSGLEFESLSGRVCTPACLGVSVELFS